MRVFLDTNVLVSAFGTRGLCAAVLQVVLSKHTLVTSETVLREFERTLRDRFRPREASRVELRAFLEKGEVVAEAVDAEPFGLRDPDDEPILAAALAAEVDVLVTGDGDLLSVAERFELPIVDPRGFWHLLRAAGRSRQDRSGEV